MLKRLILSHVEVTNHLPLMVFIFHHLLAILFLRFGGYVCSITVELFTIWKYSVCPTEITFKSVLVNPYSNFIDGQSLHPFVHYYLWSYVFYYQQLLYFPFCWLCSSLNDNTQGKNNWILHPLANTSGLTKFQSIQVLMSPASHLSSFWRFLLHSRTARTRTGLCHARMQYGRQNHR